MRNRRESGNGDAISGVSVAPDLPAIRGLLDPLIPPTEGAGMGRRRSRSPGCSSRSSSPD